MAFTYYSTLPVHTENRLRYVTGLSITQLHNCVSRVSTATDLVNRIFDPLPHRIDVP